MSDRALAYSDEPLKHRHLVIYELPACVRTDVDLTRWQALQTWIATGSAAVVVPFAKYLAALVPPVAVRLRRDFKTMLSLIRSRALLHQATRCKDEAGQIIATITDYTASVATSRSARCLARVPRPSTVLLRLILVRWFWRRPAKRRREASLV
jgi:hypothetical protein